MTDTTSKPRPSATSGGELLELAMRVAGQATAGEELEVYVSRGVETDVRAYEGEVESLSSAASAGVGIRVVVGGRQGFAYAGTLEESVLRQTLADARDNATFATADEHVGLAAPDGVAPASLDLWDDEVLRDVERGQGRDGPGARAPGPRRRSPGPPGGVRRLRRHGGRGGGGQLDRHHRHGPAHGGERGGGDHRRRRHRQPDRRRVLRRRGGRETSTSTRRSPTPSSAPPGCSVPPRRARDAVR